MIKGLTPLTDYSQWIVWQAVSRPNGHVDKVPIHPETLKAHGIDKPDILMGMGPARSRAAALGSPYGVGFVFTVDDPFFFLDVDNCLQPGGEWSPLAIDICKRFAGAAVEVSQSGEGLHIIGCGPTPTERRIRNDDAGIELYTSKRFCAITFDRVQGDAGTAHTDALDDLVRDYLQPSVTVRDATWTAAPVNEYKHIDDHILLDKALRCISGPGAFGHKATFKQLWMSDDVSLGRHYPDSHGSRAFDASAADMALAQHLAFWTGGDCDRILTLMRASALKRDKWDRPDYMERTITRAVSLQQTFYTGGGAEAPLDGPGRIEGLRLMTVEQQRDFFKGHVYVAEAHRIVTPTGWAMKPEQFKAFCGGHLFALDTLNDKTTTNAWDVFTLSRALDWPKVRGLAFRPLEPPGSFLEIKGARYYNAYVPKFGKRIEGNIEPFLRHVKLLLPLESDREILLSYMAGCVQRVGIKAQWCPMIQGVQGNGKTVLFKVLEYAIGREYCHQLDPNDLENKFNAWIECKLAIFIEEIRTSGKYNIADRLKTLITNDTVPIQGKGADQRTGDNFANFMMSSNHRDAVLKSESDRRYAPFYTAQQVLSDLERDGMNDKYFHDLYAWLRGPGSPAVAHYLFIRPITCNLTGRAPTTSSTISAKRESLGKVEQLVLEAVEMDEPGFRGGMICTRHLVAMIKSHNKSLSPQAVSGVLSELGYIRHPALEGSDGRIRIAGIQRRIYVLPGSENVKITTSKELGDLWARLQAPIICESNNLKSSR